MARLSWYLDPLSPHQLEIFIKKEVKFGPPMTNVLERRMLKTGQFKSPMYRLMNPHWSLTHNAKFVRERSDLMVECLTRDRRVTGSSLTCGTAAVCVLEQDTLISSKNCFNPGRPTWHDSKTQRINYINKVRLTHMQRRTEIILMTHFIVKLNCRFYCLN